MENDPNNTVSTDVVDAREHRLPAASNVDIARTSRNDEEMTDVMKRMPCGIKSI